MFLAQAIYEENIQCIQHNYEEKVVFNIKINVKMRSSLANAKKHFLTNLFLCVKLYIKEGSMPLIYCVDCFVLGERGNRFFVLSFLCLLAPVVYVPWTLVFFQSFLRYILTLFAHRKYKAKC